MSREILRELDYLKGDIRSCDIIEVEPLINGKISVANPKAHLLRHVEKIARIIIDEFITPSPTTESVEAMFKTKYVGHGEGGKLLLAYSSEQIDTIKQHISELESKVLLTGVLEDRLNEYIAKEKENRTKLEKISIMIKENIEQDDYTFEHMGDVERFLIEIQAILKGDSK